MVRPWQCSAVVQQLRLAEAQQQQCARLGIRIIIIGAMRRRLWFSGRGALASLLLSGGVIGSTGVARSEA